MAQDSVLIVGAGVFGLSLAFELASKRGYTQVTVLDRYPPPVPDGSSTDISRVIRSEYADPFYAKLALEAMEGWNAAYAAHYHQSGFVMFSDDEDHAYLAGARELSLRAGGGFEVLRADESEGALKKRYTGIHADLRGRAAAHNPKGGWADAAGAMRYLGEQCAEAGVKFVTGEGGIVTQIVQDGETRRATGVKTASGDVHSADRVVLATGAWTNGLLEGFEHAMGGSGQPVGFIQLSKEEADSLAPSPVMIDMDTGVFVFPPTPDTHILKVARHGFGYATEVAALASSGGQERIISAPKTFADNASAGFIPEDASDDLRSGLRRLVPQFADRPWARARLCWYTDTPESDYIADHHPDIPGLFVAAGGAGHAFKMLPALGRYTADCFEGKASPELKQKWRLRRSESGQTKVDMAGDGSRGGPAIRLLSAKEQSKL